MALTAPLACQGGGGCAVQGPTAIIANNARADYFVLANRQKYVGLQGYIPAVEYDALAFSILSQPANGQLLGTPPNMLYVPNPAFTGADSFTYQASGGGSSVQRTINLSVDSAYVPPIGISPPDFGITQSHMMYVGAMFDFGGTMAPYNDAGNGPYTHYMDFNTGSDTANPFGTPASPRKTIPANLPAGSVVEVHGQNINNALRIIVTGEGTADKPIFIRGANPTTKPVFRRPMSVAGNYIICENLEFDCQDFGPGAVGAIWFWVTNSEFAPFTAFHHIALRHSLIRDQPTTDQDAEGIAIGMRSYDPALNDANLLIENVVVYDVEVRNFSQWDDFSGSTDYSGCAVAVNTRDTWVLDCHFHHLRGDGTGASRAGAASNQTPARRVFIGRNYIHNCKENGVDYKNGVDSIMSQNVLHTFRVSSSSLGDAIDIHNNDPSPTWPACDNIWVIFNTIYDTEVGIHHENLNSLMGGNSRSYLVGNLFFDIRAIRGNAATRGVAIQKGQLSQSRIIANTIYNCDQGIWLGLASLTEPEKCTQVVRDNIIVDLTERFFNTTGKDAIHVFLTPPTIAPFTSIDHNLHFESQGKVRLDIAAAGFIEVDYFTVSDLLAGTGFGAGSVIGDPLFANQAQLDFHLTTNSPARLTGAVDEVYDTFRTQFGGSIDFYLDAAPKLPTRFDMGALGDKP